MIPHNEWRWFGSAGHLIVSSSCEFHLTTQVGDLLISTVGDYRQTRGDKDYTAIGAGRTFETMVFRVGAPCECGCGLPDLVDAGANIDFAGYTDRAAATRGHLAMCEKYADVRVPA